MKRKKIAKLIRRAAELYERESRAQRASLAKVSVGDGYLTLMASQADRAAYAAESLRHLAAGFEDGSIGAERNEDDWTPA